MTTSRLSGVYSTLIEDRMQDLFRSLSEKDRRRFAALEALRIRYGGVSYLARLFEADVGESTTVWKNSSSLPRTILSVTASEAPVPGGPRPRTAIPKSSSNW
ncbi:MAG: hypothetical protein HQ518_19020 [Rhodopirellula sp.]|nr:hypothetical protein [Rhodopirellula sp.]